MNGHDYQTALAGTAKLIDAVAQAVWLMVEDRFAAKAVVWACYPNVADCGLFGNSATYTVTLPLFRVVLSPTVTRPFFAVPRTSVARTASG